MTPGRIQGVLFDFAGTLFAPRAAHEWVRHAGDALGWDPTDDAAAALAERYLEAGLPGAPYPASVPSHLEAIYAQRDRRPGAHRAAYVALLSEVEAPVAGFAEALYEQISAPEHWIPYADTHRVVEALAGRGIRMGVISNVGFDLRPILREHGLAELADRCTLSYEHGAVKPEPALFLAALESLGLPAGSTLMVGDHPVADGGAAEVGCQILVLPMSAPGKVHGLERVVAMVDAAGRGEFPTVTPSAPGG